MAEYFDSPWVRTGRRSGSEWACFGPSGCPVLDLFIVASSVLTPGGYSLIFEVCSFSFSTYLHWTSKMQDCCWNQSWSQFRGVGRMEVAFRNHRERKCSSCQSGSSPRSKSICTSAFWSCYKECSSSWIALRSATTTNHQSYTQLDHKNRVK